jgi:hypothetical protein
MSDDEDASKSNLVCNGQTQQWQASGVEWTKEGAKFTGLTTSKLRLENFNIGDVSLGFTWLLRVKRQFVRRYRKYFLSAHTCSSNCTWGSYLYEYSPFSSSNKLRFSTSNQFPQRKSITSNLPNSPDSNEFVNIGVTAVPVKYMYQMYYNGEFVKLASDYNFTSAAASGEFSCFTIGGRCNSVDPMNATVKLVAMANSWMTQNEISEFFHLIG